MEKITREKAIQMLIEDDIENIEYDLQHKGQSSDLKDMIENGTLGWRNTSSEDLETEINWRNKNIEYKIIQ